MKSNNDDYFVYYFPKMLKIPVFIYTLWVKLLDLAIIKVN